MKNWERWIKLTRHILHVKYWSLIFSARRRTCCVIFSDGVGVVLVNGFADGIGSDKCIRSVSSLAFVFVKLLKQQINHQISIDQLSR